MTPEQQSAHAVESFVSMTVLVHIVDHFSPVRDLPSERFDSLTGAVCPNESWLHCDLSQ